MENPTEIDFQITVQQNKQKTVIDFHLTKQQIFALVHSIQNAIGTLTAINHTWVAFGHRLGYCP